MGTKTSASGDDYATHTEVEAAIRSLSDADAIRLRKIATFRARSLEGLGLGMDADDLLHEALERSLKGGSGSGPGARRWRKGVSFVKHLDQSMRSIASHARESLRRTDVTSASQEDYEGRMEGIAMISQTTDAERLAAAREQLQMIQTKFANDDLVGLVIEGLSAGMKGPEIQKDLGISQTQFETAMTNLRRGVDRKWGWRP